MSDIVEDLRKRAEIRAKIDRGDGKPDRISVQLLEAAQEIEDLREKIEWLKERVRTPVKAVILYGSPPRHLQVEQVIEDSAGYTVYCEKGKK